MFSVIQLKPLIGNNFENIQKVFTCEKYRRKLWRSMKNY